MQIIMFNMYQTTAIAVVMLYIGKILYTGTCDRRIVIRNNFLHVVRRGNF